MSALDTILRFRLREAWNRVRAVRRESLLKIAVVTVVGGGLWAGLFAGSRRSFVFLATYPEFRESVIYTTMSLLFLALSAMLVFSSAILSLGSLFRSGETSFLLSTPAPAGSVYAYKMVEGLGFSSWAFVVMGLPPMIAYGLDVSAPAAYYAGLVLFFVPFTLLAAALGTLLGLVLTVLLPRQRRRLVAWLVGVAMAFAVVLALRILYSGAGTATFSEQWMNSVLGRLTAIESRYLPHYWLTHGLLMLAAARPADAATSFAALWATAVFAVLLGDFVARRLYPAAWSIAAGGSARRRYKRGIAAAVAETLASPAGRVSALFVSKDARIFLRDPVQWSQVGIFFGILAIYILNLRSLQYDFSRGFWLHLVSTLNLGAMSLTLATLTTRFVFPQTSLEGRRFWVLGLAPVRRREILFGKFAFSLGGTGLIAVSLVALSNYMLRMPGEVFIAQAIAAAFICVGLTGLAVGLGAVFPDYRETNPSRIVSGFGGTLTLVLSVIFVAAIVGIMASLSYGRLATATMGPRAFTNWAVLAAGLAGLATALTAGVPLAWGVRAIERAEF